jgi:protein SCO1/2
MSLSLGTAARALVAIVIFLIGALVLGWWRTDGPGAGTKPPPMPLALEAMDFELVSHEGGVTGPQDWIGRPTLVFFGFTWCPDICPTTLSNISGWLDDLGTEAAGLNVAFASVDPERDTPAILKEYVSAFHPQIVGFSATASELARAAAGFAAFYEKVGSGADYAMNHTAGVLLYDKDGRFAGTIDPHEPAEFAQAKLRRFFGP